MGDWTDATFRAAARERGRTYQEAMILTDPSHVDGLHSAYDDGTWVVLSDWTPPLRPTNVIHDEPTNDGDER